jgi:hypothetical protein
MREPAVAWDDPESIRANTAGRLAPGQRELVLGGPVRPPWPGLITVGVGLAAGVVLAVVGQLGPGIDAFFVLLAFGGAAMATNLDVRRRRRGLRHDLVEPRLGQGYGAVVADPRGGVEIRTGTATIGLGIGAPPPQPGRYLLFWLENPQGRAWEPHRVLLSAQPVDPEPADGPSPTGSDPDASRALLALALGQSEWELAHNRRGELSPPQRRALGVSVRRSMLGCGAAVLVAIGCAVLSGFELSDPAHRSNMDDLVGSIIPAGFALAILGGAGVVGAGLLRRRAVLTAAAPVARRSGPVAVARVALEGENDLDWRLTLGPLRFDVNTAVARGFFAAGSYTLYYLPHGPRLLGAEPTAKLGAEPAAPDRLVREAWPRTDWVEANAAGTLTPDQRDLLVGRPARLRAWYLIVLVTALVGGGLAARLSTPGPPDTSDTIIGIVAPATITVTWLSVYALLAAARRRRARRTDAGRIQSSTGEIRWQAGEYRARAGDTELVLVWRNTTPPVPGTYRLYWLPGRTPVLLSAQPSTLDTGGPSQFVAMST